MPHQRAARGFKTSKRTAALVLMLVCACLARAQGPSAAKVDASGDAVIFKGQINAASVAQFLRLLDDGGIRRLVITSPGGSVAAALDMAVAVHERGLDIEVPTTCLSSCANYVFPAARHKIIGRPGAVGWHGNMLHVLYQEQTGAASWSESEMRSARELAARETKFFRRIGVDGFVCWFAKLEPYDVEAFYYLSREDMEGFGIRDVVVHDERPALDPRQVRKVLVDWAHLEASRPVVKLDE